MPAWCDPRSRLDNYSDKTGGPHACWPWLGTKSRKGYGGFRAVIDGTVVNLAHRAAYALAYGHPAPGLVIDHVCERRDCVNPAHLRAVTNRVNVMIGNGACAVHARKTECLRGHRLSGDNLIIHRRGFRQCRTCLRASQARWYTKKKLGLDDDAMLVLGVAAAAAWFSHYVMVTAKEALAL